jgi:hypothetical protein
VGLGDRVRANQSRAIEEDKIGVRSKYRSDLALIARVYRGYVRRDVITDASLVFGPGLR